MQVAKIRCRWDDSCGVEPGWYCETFNIHGTMLDDSQKIWFPINVDEFNKSQKTELKNALYDAFEDVIEVTFHD